MCIRDRYDDWLIKDIPELIRPAIFIPETRKINLLFQSMQSKKLQMVMVADEYGQTAGLIALEDILEEIVGNIQDEYDEDENFEMCIRDRKKRVSKDTELVKSVKDWVDKEYESGRVTVITDEELLNVITESCKKLNFDLV